VECIFGNVDLATMGSHLQGAIAVVQKVGTLETTYLSLNHSFVLANVDKEQSFEILPGMTFYINSLNCIKTDEN
jgi:hypothetical protein